MRRAITALALARPINWEALGRVMQNFQRYAVYYAPKPGAFRDRAAAWLGWEPEAGTEVPHPDLGLPVAELTRDPRRYGFHGTLKPPFRLAQGRSFAALDRAMDALSERLAPVEMEGLAFQRLAGFLALMPQGDSKGLQALAADIVRALDPFRAPLSAADLAKRPPEGLSPRQRALQVLYGYPYVLEEFRFHLTLTDKLPPDRLEAVETALRSYFDGALPERFRISDICLFGEAEEGRFRLIRRYQLTGVREQAALAAAR